MTPHSLLQRRRRSNNEAMTLLFLFCRKMRNNEAMTPLILPVLWVIRHAEPSPSTRFTGPVFLKKPQKSDKTSRNDSFGGF